MTETVVSRRTVMLAAVMAVLIAAIWIAVVAGVGGESVAVAISDLGSVAAVGLSAVLCLLTALSFQRGERVRTAWTIIGAGVMLFALGDVAWSYYELVVGEVPYPGLPDAFYLASVPLIGIGMSVYAMGFRGIVDWKRAAFVTWAAVLIGLVAVWVVILGPTVFADPEISLAEKLVSAAYPIFDVVAAFGPAVYLIVTISALGTGRLGWPWWAVGAGAVLLAITDTAFAVLQASDAYYFGHPVDFGWMIGFALIALGALIQRDVLAA